MAERECMWLVAGLFHSPSIFSQTDLRALNVIEVKRGIKLDEMWNRMCYNKIQLSFSHWRTIFAPNEKCCVSFFSLSSTDSSIDKFLCKLFHSISGNVIWLWEAVHPLERRQRNIWFNKRIVMRCDSVQFQIFMTTIRKKL